jgi:adenosylcobinamide kinase/adenosylcobinamide-phosphate guanylyltransferase
MNILYFGGQKSGKSRLAESKALEIATTKPYYIATYDSSYADSEMQLRISKHIESRDDRFVTIEESRDIADHIDSSQTYLIDCISMWILNTLDSDIDTLLGELKDISHRGANVIFVLNDVNSGIIPLDSQSRRYVDRSGLIGQELAKLCDSVYEVKLGLPIKLK